MSQTFRDLCRERLGAGKGLAIFTMLTMIETSASIVKENMIANVLYNKRVIRPLLLTGGLLLVPAIAMKFTQEVSWGLFDFLVAGFLLFGAALTYELLVKRVANFSYRAAVGLAVGTALFLVWANLAVGIVGSEDNPFNLLYAGVLAVAVSGALISRLKARGMVYTLLATALAQALVAVAAIGLDQTTEDTAISIINVNLLFIELWIGSALLFLHASANSPSQQQA
jgi:hypothetical protein